MNNLEDRIIKKVYTCETVGVCTGTGLKLVLLTLAGFFILSFAIFALHVVSEHRIFDLLSLELFLALASVITSIVLVFTTLTSLKKISCRVRSVVRYWFVPTK